MASRVYLDNAATAPLRPEVLEAMLPWMGLAEDGSYGNASTLSVEGKRARQALEAARASIAETIGASPPEIIFTSGGTESNNSLIAGLTAGIRQKYGRDKGGNLVITSAFEHHAILEPVHNLHSNGWQTELLKPTRNGLIEPELLAAAIQAAEPTAQAAKTTACSLVSIMTVNNEIGTVQPIAELAEIAHASGALFHTDAVQALGKIPFDVRSSAVDAASFSAHKLGGPKGVGAFFLRSLTPFKSFMLGGKQERGLRSGTANVAGAVGMARALQLALTEQAAEHSRLLTLRDQLLDGLVGLSPRIHSTIDYQQVATLPHIISILVDGYESESLILSLDEAGFAVSGGSACSTGSLDPSHVLLALGLDRQQAQSVLRISLGHQTTASEITAFGQAVASIVSR